MMPEPDAERRALEALLVAARSYYEASLPGAPDHLGIAPRLWAGAQLRLAAEAWARIERSSPSSATGAGRQP